MNRQAYPFPDLIPIEATQTRGLTRTRPLFADRLYEAIFSRILVYTILFEDNEPDLAFLSLSEGDRVLSIGGAGCGIAAMLADSPARIDVVDINAKHLAITGLKVSAARSLAPYEELHDLFATGRHSRPQAIVARLSHGLPPALRHFWVDGWKLFQDDFYSHGLYTRNLNIVRRFWPITPDYLKQLNKLAPEQRASEVATLLSDCLRRNKLLAALIRSPLSILAAGINYTQRERNLRAVGADDVVDGVIDYASRLAHTDIEENWIAWHIATGRFNAERPLALPVYLRPQTHERSLGSSTSVHFWRTSLLARLQREPTERWTHFCLSDVVDWLSDGDRTALLMAIHRAAAPGARVVCRTVEDSTIIDELGLSSRFRLVEPESTEASRVERSRLYRRVNFYEVLE
ncbi:MAG: DUF3419 family protein [Gemmatimonadota bacterium]